MEVSNDHNPARRAGAGRDLLVEHRAMISAIILIPVIAFYAFQFWLVVLSHKHAGKRRHPFDKVSGGHS